MLQFLSKIFTRKTIELEAKLTGHAGHTGYGELELSRWSDGRTKGEVELRGVAGTRAHVTIDDTHSFEIPVQDGRADFRFDNSHLSVHEQIDAGAPVEIKQNGDTILTGVLQLD